MFTTNAQAAPSPNQLLSTYRSSHATLLTTGQIKPFIYPYHFLPVYLILLYFLIPHKRRPWLYAARWLIFAAVVAFEVKAMREVRCMSMGVSYAAGLMGAWFIVWGATVFIWNRPQWDFKRVEERGAWQGRRKGETSQESMESQSNHLDEGKQSCQENGYTNGTARRRNTGDSSNGSATSGLSLRKEISLDSKDSSQDEESKYYWQSYPDGEASFRERLNWVVDMFLNFRGPGWNWAVPGLPPLPSYITSNLSSSPDTNTKTANPNPKKGSPDPKYELISNPQIRRTNILKFITGIFALDILKTLMMHDPYFYLGPNAYPPPTHLPSLIAQSPFLLRTYRSLFSLIGILTALQTTFIVVPLLVNQNYILGPKNLGLRGHDFMYPPIFGEFIPNILDKGLAGFWGGWWHQTFRFAFSSPTAYFIKRGWIDRRSWVGKLVALGWAFGISSFLHFSGSLTQVGETRPWNPVLFFVLQGVGILVQNLFVSISIGIMRFSGIKNTSIPKSITRLLNLLFVSAWLLSTAPLLIDDLARGGVWLVEPLPFSLLRGMGFGTEGDGWWCWGTQHGRGNGIGVGWYWGMEGRWWESGLAIF